MDVRWELKMQSLVELQGSGWSLWVQQTPAAWLVFGSPAFRFPGCAQPTPPTNPSHSMCLIFLIGLARHCVLLIENCIAFIESAQRAVPSLCSPSLQLLSQSVRENCGSYS